MKEILQKILDESDVDLVYNFIDEKTKAISEQEVMNYSDIARFVFDINTEDKEYIYRNLNKLKNKSEKENNIKLKNIIIKIKNHIDLEICRLEYLEEKQKEELSIILTKLVGNTTSKVSSMKEELKSYSKKIDKHNDEINNWYTNIITILGLFAAIVLTFFGGLSAISSIFTNIDTISKYRLLFIVLLVVFAMLNIVFITLYYIAKISNKNIHRECINSCINKDVKKENSLAGKKNICESKKNVFCSIKRYPMIFYFNIIILIMLTISLGMYFLKV